MGVIPGSAKQRANGVTGQRIVAGTAIKKMSDTIGSRQRVRTLTPRKSLHELARFFNSIGLSFLV